ncbi:hypothetical protein BWGOE4_24390 [Bacillus mycoides]|nr:hypothetical protein BWGOE4_24390 [Bacillus mycoides]OFD66192.1 hypothetical protein BWGOE7_23720 [Bacillus mycoides]OFD95955.1 hypothetical protein BWGOE12_24300 [Bacillus mycoides]
MGSFSFFKLSGVLLWDYSEFMIGGVLMKSETLHTQEDILKMMDSLLRPAVPFWNEFYTNREKDVPFLQMFQMRI